MSATNQCIIEEFLIHSDRRKEGEKPFDLTPYIASVDYFEDIFSPCITLKVLVVNEAQVVTEDEEDTENEDENEGGGVFFPFGVAFRCGRCCFCDGGERLW